ncbi:hypothetical protein D3C80_612430 [compost metagenome]
MESSLLILVTDPRYGRLESHLVASLPNDRYGGIVLKKSVFSNCQKNDRRKRLSARCYAKSQSECLCENSGFQSQALTFWQWKLSPTFSTESRHSGCTGLSPTINTDIDKYVLMWQPALLWHCIPRRCTVATLIGAGRNETLSLSSLDCVHRLFVAKRTKPCPYRLVRIFWNSIGILQRNEIPIPERQLLAVRREWQQ